MTDVAEAPVNSALQARIDKARATAAAAAVLPDGTTAIKDLPGMQEIGTPTGEVEGLAVYSAPSAGLSQYDPAELAEMDYSQVIDDGDRRLPKLKTAQGLSAILKGDNPTDVHLGDWYLDLDGTRFGKKVEIIPLDVRKGRSLFVQGRTLCASRNMVLGIGTPGGQCVEIIKLPGGKTKLGAPICPLAKWTKDPETGKEMPPKCGLTYRFPVLVRALGSDEEFRVAVLDMRSGNAKAGKEIIEFKQQRARLGDYSDLLLSLSTFDRPFAKGSAFMAKVDYIGSPPEDVRSLVLEYGNITQDEIEKSGEPEGE